MELIMRDILPDLDNWAADDNQSIALATVIETWDHRRGAPAQKWLSRPMERLLARSVEVVWKARYLKPECRY